MRLDWHVGPSGFDSRLSLKRRESAKEQTLPSNRRLNEHGIYI